MKIQLTSLLFVALAWPAIGQKHVYDDLLLLYVDEAYEKCISKAERYAARDDARKDPLPYLYLSMCHHEMSKQEAYYTQDEYRHAERDALKYAVRFRKKDKELAYFHHYEDFWMSLNSKAMETATNHYEQGEFSKARRIFDRMVAYMPENPGAWRMRALCQERMNLKREAAESAKGFEVAWKAVADPGRLPKDQQRLLRYALVTEAEVLLAKGDGEAARAVMALGEDSFMSNAEFRALYRELN